MAQSVTYTGENSAVKLPDLDKLIRSQERVGEMTIAGQEKLLQRKREDSNFVLEQMKANPVLLISDRLRTQQADAIKKYNEYGAKLLQQNDGVLSDDAKLALQREKDALTMMQQTMQADQQRFAQEFALMQKDQGSYYDEKEFKAAMDSFYETGQYPPTALIAKPKDAFALLGALKPVSETRVPQEGDTGYDITSKMTLDQAKLAIRNTMLRDEGSVRGFLKVFEALPEAEQALVLDTSGDGAVDPTEREVINSVMDVNNPIVQWAESYEPFIQQAMGMKTVPRTATQEKGNAPTPKPFKPNEAITSDNNRNATHILTNKEKPIGIFTFPSFINIKESTTGMIALNNAKRAKDGKVMPQLTLEVHVVGYSPQTDEIVVAAKTDDMAKGIRKGEEYILDGETYRGLVENKDIGLHRASYKGFKQGGGQPSFQGSYAEYKEKYPNGTPEEYRTLTGNK
jgi:hypothetical protein